MFFCIILAQKYTFFCVGFSFTFLLFIVDVTFGSNARKSIIFEYNGTSWNHLNAFVSDTSNGDKFGYSVDIYNGQIVVCSPEAYVNNTEHAGECYLFNSLLPTKSPTDNEGGATGIYFRTQNIGK